MSSRYKSMSSLSMFKKTAYDSTNGSFFVKKFSVKAGKKKGKIAHVSVKIEENGEKKYTVTYKDK